MTNLQPAPNPPDPHGAPSAFALASTAAPAPTIAAAWLHGRLTLSPPLPPPPPARSGTLPRPRAAAATAVEGGRGPRPTRGQPAATEGGCSRATATLPLPQPVAKLRTGISAESTAAAVTLALLSLAVGRRQWVVKMRTGTSAESTAAASALAVGGRQRPLLPGRPPCPPTAWAAIAAGGCAPAWNLLPQTFWYGAVEMLWM